MTKSPNTDVLTTFHQFSCSFWAYACLLVSILLQRGQFTVPPVILIIAPTAATLSVPLSGIFEIILRVIPRIGSQRKADENGDEENPAVAMEMLFNDETTSGCSDFLATI